MRSLTCIFTLLVLTGVAAAERPRLITIDDPLQPHITEAVAPYNTIFLNRCANGCPVKSGNNDARIDTSSIVSGSRVLTKFTYGDDVWNQVKACVRDTFAPFNVVITDTDPGSANHFEIMIGGVPSDLGFNPNIGGVSANGCGNTYIPNALVFDFSTVWGTGTSCNARCVEDICSTAAQEIAHSFGMDHSHNKLDPMTYFQYAGRKYFQTTADQCGSDCTGGVGPSGQTCTGADQQVHSCCGATSTQNSAALLTSLFGAGTLQVPTVLITKPQQGASVQAGFAVNTTITADAAITKAELRVDGVLVDPVVMSAPYAFNAPTTLQPGSHTVEVTGYDAHGTPGKTSITVTIGPPCTDDSTCGTTEVCIAGRCVPGPNATGGLGTSCTSNDMCGDGNCASDGTNMYCTTACHAGQCPKDFGCLPVADGSDAGYCWPGYSDGTGGGCSTAGGAGGSIASGLLFAAVLFTRRRKR
jgi:uncharacterized protein (TIGR03382 family)